MHTDPIRIQISNRSDNPIPTHATVSAAGMDLRANLQEDVTLAPGEHRLIPTGLHIALPVGTEAQVRPRSGLAYKHGVTVLNSPGTIDADYRGDVGVILINHGKAPFVVRHGERIAQIVVARYLQVDWMPVDTLDETERGAGGFGHSGVE